MSMVDDLRRRIELSVGNRGALRNCEQEMARRRQIDEDVAHLAARVPAPVRMPESATA